MKEKITGAEYAERILRPVDPKRNIDHLLEELSPETGLGWESTLLELKDTYHPVKGRPDPDDKYPQKFEWNVVKAFIELANAYGGCVVIGLRETEMHEIVPGEWNPDGIKGEENKIVDHAQKVLLAGKNKKERSFRFFASDKDKPEAPPKEYVYTLSGDTMSRLDHLVKIYACHSATHGCNVLAAIVRPVLKGESLIEFSQSIDGRKQGYKVCYRDKHAKAVVLETPQKICDYAMTRDPASDQFGSDLHRPLHPRRDVPAITFSTVPAPLTGFLGRETELEELRHVLADGKIPLLHAEPGTGKTELAFKYAEQFATDYPGGCFYLPMEHAATWTDALPLLIESRPSTIGLTPCEWLELGGSLRAGGDGSDDSCTEKLATLNERRFTPSEIVNALVRKVRNAGPILLVLDNLENPGRFLSDATLAQVFPQGVPNGVHLLGTARTKRSITEKRAPKVHAFKLNDLPENDALRLLGYSAKDHPPAEGAAAAEILQLLDRRALYAARLGRLAADKGARPFTRILKDLRRDGLGTVAPQEDEPDSRTPLVLWKWTRKHLLEHDASGDDLRLVQAVALFPPDGMPVRTLEELFYSGFGTRSAQETLAAYSEDPDLFADAGRRIGDLALFQQDGGTVRIHRLERDAIRRDLGDNLEAWRQTVGRALRQSLTLSPRDWVALARAKSDLLAFCPWELLRGEQVADLLILDPGYQAYPIPWQQMSALDWWRVCKRHPAFIETAHARDIPLTPLLAPLDPHPDQHFNLADFCGTLWALLLADHPEFDAACPFERLTKNDWLLLLAHRPELLEKCQHPEILNCPGQDFGRYSRRNVPHDRGLYVRSFWDIPRWGTLLSRQPAFADRCNWAALSRWDVLSILDEAPAFADQCPKDALLSLSGSEWTNLLVKHPELVTHYPAADFPKPHPPHEADSVRLDGWDATWIDEAYGFKDDNGANWIEILDAHPTLADRCPFANLPVVAWCRLLLKHPEYGRFNPPWDQIGALARKPIRGIFEGEDELYPFSGLLRLPELAAFRLDDITISDADEPYQAAPFESLYNSLQVGPPLAKIADFLQRHPPQAKKYPLSVYFFVAFAPQIARMLFGKVPPPPKSFFFETMERALLDAPRGLDFPIAEHLVQMGPDNRISVDESPVKTQSIQALKDFQQDFGSQTFAVLQGFATGVSVDRSEQELVRDGLALRVCCQPEIAPKIDWSLFSGLDLCLILLNRPTLEKYCDFSKLTGSQWAVLLARNPAFAPKCDWSRLSDEDWSYLRADRPWMTPEAHRTTSRQEDSRRPSTGS